VTHAPFPYGENLHDQVNRYCHAVFCGAALHAQQPAAVPVPTARGADGNGRVTRYELLAPRRRVLQKLRDGNGSWLLRVQSCAAEKQRGIAMT